MTRVGVVIFPGSNGDDDALHAIGLAGAEPVAAVARIGGPRRRRRGDPARRLRLWRLPAGRGDRPVQPGHAGGRGVRRRGRPRPRDLQRLPGPRRGRARARRPAPQSRPALPGPRRVDRARAPRHAVHPGAGRRAGRCACRSPTARAATTPTRRPSTSSSATARSSSATSAPDGGRAGRRRAGQPERLAAGDRRRPQRGRQCRRPDAPSGAGRRGRPGQRRRAGDHPLAGRARPARGAADAGPVLVGTSR